MKKIFIALLVIACCLTGCSSNLYLKVDEEMSSQIFYEINQKFEYSDVKMTIYRLDDNHWNVLKTDSFSEEFDADISIMEEIGYDFDYDGEDNEPTGYLYFDCAGFGYPLFDQKTAKDTDGCQYFTNTEKEGLVLDYNEKPIVLNVFVYDHDAYSETGEYLTSNTFHLYEVDPNDEFEAKGCYMFLITVQFIK